MLIHLCFQLKVDWCWIRGVCFPKHRAVIGAVTLLEWQTVPLFLPFYEVWGFNLRHFLGQRWSTDEIWDQQQSWYWLRGWWAAEETRPWLSWVNFPVRQGGTTAMAESERYILVWDIRQSPFSLSAEDLFHIAKWVGPFAGQDQSELQEEDQ